MFFSHQGKKAPEVKILFKWNGVNGYSLHIFLGFTLYKNESEDKQEEIFLLQKIPYKYHLVKESGFDVKSIVVLVLLWHKLLLIADRE